MGYTNVRHYAGGIKTWAERGEPIESGEPGATAGETEAAVSNDADTDAAEFLEIVTPADAPAGGATTVPPSMRARRRRKALGWFGRTLESMANMSFNRLISLWLGLVVLHGLAYWVLGGVIRPSLVEAGRPIGADLHGLVAAIYFSFVDATSLGLGDIVPVGPARLLAIFEGVSALLIFGCVISKLVSHRQEVLIEEIHRNAFESRLGRVRTNLHMVLSEIQNIGEVIDEHGFQSERVTARLESASMVFGGELIAIHDLLYRPQQAPEERELEALLANLAASMREFSQIVEKIPRAGGLSPVLRTGFTNIATLASEICGECVPREYAPERKVWMDRIQQLAYRIAARSQA